MKSKSPQIKHNLTFEKKKRRFYVEQEITRDFLNGFDDVKT